MAHTKAQRAVRGNRDSRAKRRGVKIFGGAPVFPGNIILRQKGSKVRPGDGTMICDDFTIMALKKGVVLFKQKQGNTYVSVVDSPVKN